MRFFNLILVAYHYVPFVALVEVCDPRTLEASVGLKGFQILLVLEIFDFFFHFLQKCLKIRLVVLFHGHLHHGADEMLHAVGDAVGSAGQTYQLFEEWSSCRIFRD